MLLAIVVAKCSRLLVGKPTFIAAFADLLRRYADERGPNSGLLLPRSGVRPVRSVGRGVGTLRILIA
jgi:hypothetical protein